jgi:hypothetical protein
MNKVTLCFIVPPPSNRLHSSWRAIVYAKEQPEKQFVGTRTLPSEIAPNAEIMKQELCDPDHIPAHIVQLTQEEQYVYVEGDVCEVIGTEIHMADGHNDPYLKGNQAATITAPKKSTLTLPGQPGQPSVPPGGQLSIGQLVTTSAQAASLGAGGPINLENTWIVDLTFKTNPVTDQSVIDKVKAVAWGHGLNL